MRNIALILFLLLSISAIGQIKIDTIGTNFVYYENIDNLKLSIDSSLKSCKRNFYFVKLVDFQSTVQIIYESKDSVSIVFSFDKLLSGKDEALEIKGKVYYKLQTIRGRFLDLFPIWNTKFDLNSAQDIVVKDKTSKVVYVRVKEIDYLCRLYGYGENWMINVSKQIKPHYTIK